MAGASGYHDVIFSPDGFAIGSGKSGRDLLKSDYAGAVTPLAAGVGLSQQLAWLPNGDLAAASYTKGIQRITAAGSSTTINGNVRPYGLILGPDDMLYAAVEFDNIYRVDPTTGDATVWLSDLPHGSPRVINFNLDYTAMYVGTRGGKDGELYSVPIDVNLNPTGPPQVFATGVGTGTYHDTLGVDLCGYLYVSDYTSGDTYRISPAGQVDPLLEGMNFLHRQYGHGMAWGNGVNGWRTDAIYMAQPYNGNTVKEVVIGVPSRSWTGGYAINLP